MELFDTHAHYLDERFDPDRDEVLLSLKESGVSYCVEACCDSGDIEKVLELVKKYDFIYGSAGVHPHSAGEMTNADLDVIDKALNADKMVAIGEIGLDYHYDFSPRDEQRKWFSAQLELARQRNVPVIIHDREAHGDMMDILRANRSGLKGIMHCFSGSYEIARDCLDLGLYIAFGGSLTFKNAVNLQAVAARLPKDRLLIETDCPYMTPVPHRGERNDSRLMHLTLNKLAELQKISSDELAHILMHNSKTVFNID